MIFSAPRFVVVDDKEQHLLAITQAFQQLGSPCLGIHYDPAEDLNRDHFRSVRCLFFDLHLMDGLAGTDHRRHYALIASILEENISPRGGPFILVVWTEHAHLKNELQEYLEANLDPTKLYTRPLAVLSLAKEEFIHTDTGTVKDSIDIRNAIRHTVLSNAQLAVLLGWESDVQGAAGDTMASLLNLIPITQRTSASFSGALDKILSRLAREAVGPKNVELDHRAAINNALAPILIDRIMNQRVEEHPNELWKKAVTLYEDESSADADEAGPINWMLHLATPDSEKIRPTDWGAVVAWPFGWTDNVLSRWTGLTIQEMLCDEFKLKTDAKYNPVLVRIGAACDYAQNKKGPITYLFALEVLEEYKQKNKTPDSIWKSPTFVNPTSSQVFRLNVHVRFPITCIRKSHCRWTSRYRLREQLLMNLITSASNYMSRPGIVQLPVR
ncbi:hypothetical protein [Methylogaea oryzae]|uniref:Response receiver domain-containing protein n=1 Tax=Methylogaea oryzae TaxID=1295382 RepID=A0A8D5AIN6_9GAMM|nr:hypothetical protein [Methylogaea oryzae]BBL71546.1 hypothetical protein MoryE10_21520 [Methylogaea oryzae]